MDKKSFDSLFASGWGDYRATRLNTDDYVVADLLFTIKEATRLGIPLSSLRSCSQSANSTGLAILLLSETSFLILLSEASYGMDYFGKTDPLDLRY